MASMALTACIGSTNVELGSETSDSDDGPNLCELFTEPGLANLDASMIATLPGAQRTSLEPAGDTCEIRYESGADWIELTVQSADAFRGTVFIDVNEDITTDGATLSTAQTDEGVLAIEASTSDPAAISTWDASLAGAFALTL